MKRRVFVAVAWPLFFVYLFADQEDVRSDAARWLEILEGRPRRWNIPPTDRVTDVLYLAGKYPEFRTLLYYRARRTGMAGKLAAKLAGVFYRGAVGLELGTGGSIGPGLFIEHGTSSIVRAESWGRDGWLNQQVTIGGGNGPRLPVLGEGVWVRAGAKVLGGVTVGSGCHIGANAVVVKDQPKNSIVVGIPARAIGPNDTAY